MTHIKVYDERFAEYLADDAVIVTSVPEADLPLIADPPEEDASIRKQKEQDDTHDLLCTCCLVSFENVVKYRAHYKLDWHRFNLKQRLRNRPLLTEDEFEEQAEISSLSGSDSDVERDNIELQAPARNRGRIFIVSPTEPRIIRLYRCLLGPRYTPTANLKIDKTAFRGPWAIFMLGGGHFAGGIFQNGAPLQHRTFHYYTKRAKQGGSQSTRDNKGGHAPKSAGATLRRYNERVYASQVRATVLEWKEVLQRCKIIFYRAAGPANSTILFGQSEVLSRRDARVRNIPFSTRRATFSEMVRTVGMLASTTVYDSASQLHEEEGAELATKKKRVEGALSSEVIVTSDDDVAEPEPQRPSSSEDEPTFVMTEMRHSVQEQLTAALNLPNHGDAKPPTNEPNKRPPNVPSEATLRRREERDAKKRERKEQMYHERVFAKNVAIAVRNHDSLLFATLLLECKPLFGKPVDDDGNTALHFCAEHGHCEFVVKLLAAGADPTLKNKRNQTPYACTQDPQVRDTFRKFAKTFPKLWNYQRAQIPLTAELDAEEIAERKARAAEQKRMKRQRDRERKEMKKREEEQKAARAALAAMPSREQCALAAERRLLNASGKPATGASGKPVPRCCQCMIDISGMVPFEYCDYKFCSITCLQAHRISHPTKTI